MGTDGVEEADAEATAGVDEREYPDAVDTEARRLLYDLVTTPSPSGDEAAAAAVLADYLDAAGRSVRIDDAGNVRAPSAVAAPEDAVLLTSHVDTVPGEVPVRVERVPGSAARWGGAPLADGDESTPELWGRGSVDATGSLAAMAVAAVETGAAFAAVVGEETDSRGARHLIEDRPAPDAVINGEPSGWDAVTLGYRGFLAAEYAVRTPSVHSSRPDPNAVQHATAWCERVADAVATDGGGVDGASETADDGASEGTEDAGDGSSIFESVTAKPVGVDAGPTEDCHAVAAEVETQFRIPPGSSAAAIRESVAAVTDAGEVTWGEPIPPSATSPRTDPARAFRVAVRRAGGDLRLLRKTGTADANLYDGAWATPVVTYGPGDSGLDHTAEERLPLPELDRAAGVLSSVVERLR